MLAGNSSSNEEEEGEGEPDVTGEEYKKGLKLVGKFVQ